MPTHIAAEREYAMILYNRLSPGDAVFRAGY